MYRRAEQNQIEARRIGLEEIHGGRRRPELEDGFWPSVRGRFRPVRDIGTDRQEWCTAPHPSDAFSIRLRRGTVS